MSGRQCSLVEAETKGFPSCFALVIYFEEELSVLQHLLNKRVCYCHCCALICLYFLEIRLWWFV